MLKQKLKISLNIVLCLLFNLSFSSCFPELKRSPLELVSFLRLFSPPTAISSFRYANTPFTFTSGAAISTITPVYEGSISSCTVSPSLPSGISLDSSNCAISGTPTTNQSATEYQIVASNSRGSAPATISIAITSIAPSAFSYSGSTFSFSQTLAIISQSPTVTGMITSCSSSPALPAGLLLSSSCVLSGTPTALQGNVNYTITASNSFGSTSVIIGISVVLPVLPTVTSTSPADNATVSLTGLIHSVTFSQAMNVASILVNITDNTCSGTIQLSPDNFATCYRMTAQPTASVGDTVFSFTPHANNPIFANKTVIPGIKIRVTTAAQNAATSFMGAIHAPINGFFTSGLLRQYAFTLGVLDDHLGANTLTPFGGSVATSGKDGEVSGAFPLNGSTQYFTGLPAGLPTGASPRTLCSWVNPAQLPTTGNTAVILSYGLGSNNNAYGFYLDNSAGTNRIGIYAWGPGNFPFSYTLPINTWSHLCVTFNGTSSSLFVNGKSIVSGGPVINTTIIAGFVRIGRQGVLGQYFNGRIDDVQIFDAVLPTLQIRNLATQIPAGLIARYDMLDTPVSSTVSVLDSSGSWNHLTASATIPGQVNDRFGQTISAHNLNGTSSNVSKASPVTVLTANVAMSAWVRPTTLTAGNQEILVNGTSLSGYAIRMDASGNLGVLFGGGGASILTTTKLPINAWSHVVLSNSAGTWTLYLNGYALTSSASIAVSPATGFYIGSNQLGTDYFNGDIDDVRVYNRALPVNEIQALVQQPNKRIFVTTSNFNGAMTRLDLTAGTGATGIAKADNWCNIDPSKPTTGTYKAMIVDGLVRRGCTTGNCVASGIVENIDWVLRPNITYLRTDGITQIFTTNWNAVSTTFTVGVGTAGEVWTGLTVNWTTNTSCLSWTSNLVGNTASVGDSTAVFNLINRYAQTCDRLAPAVHLYCVEQ